MERVEVNVSWNIGHFFYNEHPQIVAFILTRLPEELVSEVLSLSQVEVRNDIVYRLATLGTVPLGALEDLEESLISVLEETGSMRGVSPSHINGKDFTVNVLRGLDIADRESVLSYLDGEDNPLAEDIRTSF